MTNLRIQLFGGFSITLNDKEVLPGRRTSRTALLLAFLLLKRNRRQSREQLAYMFWMDSSDMQARTNLRSVLASLRKQAPALAPYLQDDDAYLCWRTDQSQEFDVDAFESALQQAALLEDADAAVPVTVLEKAVSLYAGELLPGYYEDWVLAERMRLHMAYLDALIWLVDLLEKSGHLRKAIRYAEMLLQADRLRETSHLLLMRLCAAAGDRARALAIYADCARLLVEELGVEPGPAIEQLHRHLLQDSEPENGSSPDIPSGSALVGRASDWMQLLDRWRKADAGNAQVFLLTGEAGIGKTRLAQELIDWCSQRGVAALTSSCPQAQEPMPYVALANWLASSQLVHRIDRLDEDDLAYLQLLSPALRRRYPALRLAAPLTPHWQRLRLHQALAGLLADKDEPTLLFVDDAQWCDQQSLEWLHYLLATQPDARLLVVLAVRTGESEEQPLMQSSAALRAKGHLQQIELSRLSMEETAHLASQVAGRTLDEDIVTRLFWLSAGIPLYVVELVRMLDTSLDATAGVRQGRLHLPAMLPVSVSALILHRLASLSQPARQLLDAAAVIGKQFTRAILRQVDRLSDESHLHALDELWRRSLIIRVSGDVYAFDHELVREVVYRQLGYERRRLLHRRIAEALTTLQAGDASDARAQIAEHYELAGHPLEAAYFLSKVVQDGLGNVSIETAIAHLERAIDLLDQAPKTSQATEQAFTCWLQLGTLLTRHRRYNDPDVRRAFERAHQLAGQLAEPFLRFLALRGLWEVEWGTAQLTSAFGVANELLKLADQIDAGALRAEACWAQGATLFYLGEYSAAQELLRQATTAGGATFAQGDESARIYDPAVAAQCYLAFGELIYGNPDEGMRAIRQVVEAAELSAEPYTYLFALAHLAIIQNMVRDIPSASRTTLQLLTLGAHHGFAGMVSIAAKLRAWALAVHDDGAEEVDLLREMVLDQIGITAEVAMPIFVVALAEALSCHQRYDEALMVVNAGLQVVEQQGVAIAAIDLHRLHGDLLARLGADLTHVEQAHRAALDLARSQHSTLFGVRAATSLAQIWVRHGRHNEARILLQDTLALFAGPSALADWQAAHALLLALSPVNS